MAPMPSVCVICVAVNAVNGSSSKRCYDPGQVL